MSGFGKRRRKLPHKEVSSRRVCRTCYRRVPVRAEVSDPVFSQGVIRRPRSEPHRRQLSSHPLQAPSH